MQGARGGVRCRGPDCQKLAQSRGFCVAHGGGRRCAVDACPKLAQYSGVCLSHGGGRRCCVPECTKFVQIRGYCKLHAKHFQPDNPTAPSSRTESKHSVSKMAITFLVNPVDSPANRHRPKDRGKDARTTQQHSSFSTQNSTISSLIGMRCCAAEGLQVLLQASRSTCALPTTMLDLHLRLYCVGTG